MRPRGKLSRPRGLPKVSLLLKEGMINSLGVYIWVYIYIGVYIWVCIYGCVNMGVYIWVCIYGCIYIYIYICGCIYMGVYFNAYGSCRPPLCTLRVGGWRLAAGDWRLAGSIWRPFGGPLGDHLGDLENQNGRRCEFFWGSPGRAFGELLGSFWGAFGVPSGISS